MPRGKRYADDFADARNTDAVATRQGGVGNKFPTKNRNKVPGAISATTRAKAVRTRQGKGKTEKVDTVSDFAALYAIEIEGDDDDPSERTEDGLREYNMEWEERERASEPPTAQFSWDETEERDELDDVIGEETGKIISVVADAQEQSERMRYKGVTLSINGTVVKRGETAWVPIAQLIPATYNPRSITPQEMANLKGSIEEFGMPENVVVNTYPERENVIVGGHQRVEAARQLGWEQVPVSFVYLNPFREKQLNLALNRISGTWDDLQLSQVIADLYEANADMTLTGFDEGEIAELLAANAGVNDQIDLGDEFDSDKERDGVDGTTQVIVLVPATDYDEEIAQAIRVAVDSLRPTYPRIAVQIKGAK